MRVDWLVAFVRSLTIGLLLAVGLPAEKPDRNYVERPHLESKVDLQYTERARSAGVEGTVLLGAKLDEHGQLQDIVVMKGLGYGLDEKAIDCVRQWRFKPATRRGEPVSVRVRLEVNFRPR